MQEEKKFFLPLKDKCLYWKKINNRLVTLCTELVNKKLETRYIRLEDKAHFSETNTELGKSLEERTLSKIQGKIMQKYYGKIIKTDDYLINNFNLWIDGTFDNLCDKKIKNLLKIDEYLKEKHNSTITKWNGEI